MFGGFIAGVIDLAVYAGTVLLCEMNENYHVKYFYSFYRIYLFIHFLSQVKINRNLYISKGSSFRENMNDNLKIAVQSTETNLEI